MTIRLRCFHSFKDVEKEFAEIGCDIAGIKIMHEKAIFLTVRIDEISIRAAIILKQEMMAIGGDVVLSREVMTLTPKTANVLVLGTQKQYRRLMQKLYQQPFGCKEIAEEVKQFLERQHSLNFSKPKIMGIVNITPDSFSDGGKFLDPDAAVQHCQQLVDEGADMLDIGAESSRPGSDPVSEAEELNRLLPVLERLKSDAAVKVPISIDTWKPNVADICLKKGADIINDITGMQNPEMRKIIAKYNVPVVIMHMQGTPKTMQQNPQYKDVVDEVITFLERQRDICKKEGIENIMCDPGIGFGKTAEQNLEILRRLKEFQILGVPILIGTSRKSFIEKTIGGAPDERVEGTIASMVIAAQNGANLFRAHDVKACRRALDIAYAICRGKKE